MNRHEYLERVEKVITRASGTEDLPPQAAIVAMFLEPFRPILPPDNSPDNMTSHEIVERLEDTCHLTTTDVAAVMVYLGYRLNENTYQGFEWAMKHVDPVDD